jgi:glucose/arabinose dehydrogenase
VEYVGQVPLHPTTILYSPDGRLFVAQMEGNIYVLDQNGVPQVYASGFTLPIGLAFRPGTQDLYVTSRAPSYTAGKLSIVYPGGAVQDLITDLPCCYTSVEHQPNSIVFGPDGFLYMAIGARSDHGEVSGEQPDVPGELHPLEAGILRIAPDGSTVEKYASGLRNPYDLTFDAAGRLFADDNDPDFGPPEELNYVVAGGHYGWPYVPCDICFPPPAGVQFQPPIASFIPHSAPTGLVAYTASQFPSNYYNNLFLTLWSAFPGAQKIVRVRTFPTVATDFATGLAAPVDVTVAPDGSLVVADWATGHLFRIRYAGG